MRTLLTALACLTLMSAGALAAELSGQLDPVEKRQGFSSKTVPKQGQLNSQRTARVACADISNPDCKDGYGIEELSDEELSAIEQQIDARVAEREQALHRRLPDHEKKQIAAQVLRPYCEERLRQLEAAGHELSKKEKRRLFAAFLDSLTNEGDGPSPDGEKKKGSTTASASGSDSGDREYHRPR